MPDAGWLCRMWFEPGEGLKGIELACQWQAPAPTVNIGAPVMAASELTIGPAKPQIPEWVQGMIDTMNRGKDPNGKGPEGPSAGNGGLGRATESGGGAAVVGLPAPAGQSDDPQPEPASNGRHVGG